MIEIRNIIIQSTGNRWNNNNQIRKDNYKAISKDDIILLSNWLSNAKIQFKGFKGKVYFLKGTEFPRYKFTEYSRNNNEIVKKVINPKNSKAIVLNFNNYDTTLKSMLDNITYLLLIAPNEYTNSQVESVVNIEQLFKFNKYNNKEFNFITYLIDIYNNFQHLSVIDAFDLNDVINEGNSIIDTEYAKSISSLLGSKDNESIKLGMEMLTNVDFDASLLHIMLLINKHYSNMRYHAYNNSVNFSNFKNKYFNSTKIKIEYSYNNEVNKIIKSFLRLENKFIFEEDISYIKDVLMEEFNQNNNFENQGYEIINYDIKLNIDPLKIIKRPTVDLFTEPEKEINEETETIQLID